MPLRKTIKILILNLRSSLNTQTISRQTFLPHKLLKKKNQMIVSKTVIAVVKVMKRVMMKITRTHMSKWHSYLLFKMIRVTSTMFKLTMDNVSSKKSIQRVMIFICRFMKLNA